MADLEKRVSATANSTTSTDYAVGTVDIPSSIPEEEGDEYAGETMGVAKGALRRTFKTRHVQMVALGANIGSGIYISSGKVRQTQHEK